MPTTKNSTDSKIDLFEPWNIEKRSEANGLYLFKATADVRWDWQQWLTKWYPHFKMGAVQKPTDRMQKAIENLCDRTIKIIKKKTKQSYIVASSNDYLTLQAFANYVPLYIALTLRVRPRNIDSTELYRIWRPDEFDEEEGELFPEKPPNLERCRLLVWEDFHSTSFRMRGIESYTVHLLKTRLQHTSASLFLYYSKTKPDVSEILDNLERLYGDGVSALFRDFSKFVWYEVMKTNPLMDEETP
jgi:hypothetical protein